MRGAPLVVSFMANQGAHSDGSAMNCFMSGGSPEFLNIFIIFLNFVVFIR